MARQFSRPKAQKPEAPKRRCRECAHSYDWQNRSFHDGHLIFCRCQYDEKSKFGRFVKFLSGQACEHFKERSTIAPDHAEAH